jgi:hypothetical protein
VPARPLDRLTLADVRGVVSGGTPRSGDAPGEALVASLLAGAEGSAARALAGVTYAELCRKLDGEAPPAEPNGTLADFGPFG